MAEAGVLMARSMWDRPDMRQALARHDLQTVFRLMQREGCQVRVSAVTRDDALVAGWLSWWFARWHS